MQEVGGACAASGECNGGCPYKTYSQQQLRTALSRLNCNDRCVRGLLVNDNDLHLARSACFGHTLCPSDRTPHVASLLAVACGTHRVIKDVLDKVRGKHYQLACGLAFEGITGTQQDTGINKPSEYYAASIELEKQRAAAAAAAEGGKQQQPQQQQQQQHAPPSTPMAAPETAA